MNTPIDPNFYNREIPNKSTNYCYINYAGLDLKHCSRVCFGCSTFFFIVFLFMLFLDVISGKSFSMNSILAGSSKILLPCIVMAFILSFIGIFLFIAMKIEKTQINRLKENGICVHAKIVNIEPSEKKQFARESLTPMYILVCSYVNQYGHRIDYRVPTKNINPEKFLDRVVSVYINPNNFSDYMVDLDNFVM